MKRLLLLLLLVVTPVKAADLLGTFKNYAHLQRQMLGTDTTDTGYLPDTTAHQFTRIAVSAVVPPIQAVKTVLYDTTQFLKDAYSLDTTITGIISVQWRVQDTVRTVNYLPMEQWNSLPVKQASETDPNRPQDRRPFVYDYIDGTMFINPIPIQGGDSLRIVAFRQVPSIAAVDSLALIPQEYRYPVLFFSVWQIAIAKQHPMVEQYHQSYMEAIATVNAAINRKAANASAQ